jgi:glyoxylase-like metal-dependent hydrolase (beta-lactamase superfamily II)
MEARSYAFRVGKIECAVLLDGASVMGRAGILKRFPGATEADYERAYADLGLSLDEADTSFNTLVAKVGSDIVLVDAGEGGRPKGGLLPESLRLAGIEPEAVTRVVITHADGDHVHGLLTPDERPTFPNATYVLSSRELAYWQGRINAGIVNHRPYLDLMRAQGLRLIEGDAEILPGVSAVDIGGHTPGHTAVLIESRGEKVIHLADLLHSPMQFAHPEWSASFDVDTSVSVPTRRAALGRAADEDMLAVFYHLTFPGLGRVRRAGTGFAWEPVKPG